MRKSSYFAPELAHGGVMWARSGLSIRRRPRGLQMLNNYKKEVADFLDKLGEGQAKIPEILDMLEKEFNILKKALDNKRTTCHQVYDMLFLIFEIAAKYDCDLDEEWLNGFERKRKKYL